MAEIEYKGIKVGGSKLLFVIPLIGTLAGGLWGGFEFYKDYMNMRDKIESYQAPDLSGFQEQISVMRKEVETMKTLVSDAQSTARDIRTDLRGEIGDQTDQISLLDKRSRTADREVRESLRESEKEIRDLVTNTDKRWDDKLSKVDAQMNALEEKLDKKITRALKNPLANMATSK
jgi:ribosomal protein L16 Arg81 hydroxylase